MKIPSANKFILFLLLITAVGNVSIAQSRLDKTHWELEYSEEFTNNDVNALILNSDTMLRTSKPWINASSSPIGQPVHSSATACSIDWHPDTSICKEKFDIGQISIHTPDSNNVNYDPQNPEANGWLLLGAAKNNDSSSWLTSEISSTHDDFPHLHGTPGYIYGMFEIRCKLPKSFYSFTSFWLDGNAWPPEIDAFESCMTWDPSIWALLMLFLVLFIGGQTMIQNIEPIISIT